ncbi:MAG: hypothetical protein RML48_04850 [Candidatus Bipolaricaulota bacterium]|nr:hypothetical protein [Candidatus Bipolaricaulota bacterium]
MISAQVLEVLRKQPEGAMDFDNLATALNISGRKLGGALSQLIQIGAVRREGDVIKLARASVEAASPDGSSSSEEELKAVIAERDNLLEDLGKLGEELDHIRSERDQLALRVSQLQGETAQLRAERDELRRALAMVNTERDQLENALNKLGELHEDRDEAYRQLKLLRVELTALRSENAVLRQRLANQANQAAVQMNSQTTTEQEAQLERGFPLWGWVLGGLVAFLGLLVVARGRLEGAPVADNSSSELIPKVEQTPQSVFNILNLDDGTKR